MYAVQTIHELKKKLLQAETLDLSRAIKIARGIEISTHQLEDFSEESGKTVNAMNKRWRKSSKDQGRRSLKERKSGRLCSCCGRKYVGKQVCPAKGKVCFKCKKCNHYSRMCRSKTVHEVEASNNSSYEDGDFFIRVVNEVSDINDEISMQLFIEGSDLIKVKLDTGAEVNVMPVQVYNSLKTKSKVLQPTKVKLTAYRGNRISVLGTCQLKCKYRKEAYNLEVFVVNATAPTALSLKTCQDLSLIKVLMTVNKPDENANCDHEYHIQLKQGVKPVVHAARKIPVSLRDKVKRELEQMEKLNIIRRVDEPTEWASSMVVVPKPNGEVRICLDTRDLNFAVKREHY